MTKGIGAWGWETVPQRHMRGRVLRYTQAKVIGGGSTINAQIYTRGNALDYDAWAREEGCEGWSYAEVLAYFKRAEDNQRFVNAYHAAWRAARRLHADCAAADLRRLFPRRAGDGHSL